MIDDKKQEIGERGFVDQAKRSEVQPIKQEKVEQRPKPVQPPPKKNK